MQKARVWILWVVVVINAWMTWEHMHKPGFDGFLGVLVHGATAGVLGSLLVVHWYENRSEKDR